MVAQPIYDVSGLDLSKPELTLDDIRRINPHRYEFEMLSGILVVDRDEQLLVGYKRNSPDDFWVRGHIPGRPLMPGVLQIECAAQLSSAAFKLFFAEQPEGFIGFGGVDEVKFRGIVGPEDVLFMVVKAVDMRKRRSVFQAQGICNDKLVFEGTITGMPM